MHYYEYFQRLCKSKGVKESEAYNGCGLNRSSVSRWRSAFEEGKEMKMSAKAAAGIARYFELPIENVLRKEDKYGLTDNDWRMMGTVFENERKLSGKSIEDVTDENIVTALELTSFEDFGEPLTPLQLSTICGMIYKPASVVFSLWANKLWGEKEKPAKSEGMTDDDIVAAFWGGDDELTQEDKEALWADAKDFIAFKTAQLKAKKKEKQ